MTLPSWKPPELVMPSVTYRGEDTSDVIYAAVGKALHCWEHAESALTRLFQVFCESRSRAACRAYGVIESPFTKAQVLKAAADTFFAVHPPRDEESVSNFAAIIKAYSESMQYRNNIAHGMTVGFYLEGGEHSGYFLCPPSYTSKKVKMHPTDKVYLLGASYLYKSKDVHLCAERFTQILNETVRLSHHLNEKYNIIPPEELQP